MKSDNKKKIRRIYYKLKGIFDYWKIAPFLVRHNKFTFKPVFVIGCGRSGTTILGNTLGQHKSICYLNERRDLWHRAYPELDIWSGKYKHPLLVAIEENADSFKTQKLRRLFFREQVAANAEVLLEKLPINNFRLRFLNICFPDAKYIYLYRNGLEVAESISKKIPNGWFGYKNLKWKLLEAFGHENNFEYAIDDMKSDFHKGMFEWRLSMEESEKFFKKMSPEKYIGISYNNLVEDPKNTLKSIFEFLALDVHETFIEHIASGLERKNKKIVESNDPVTLKIGGDFLAKSIANTY